MNVTAYNQNPLLAVQAAEAVRQAEKFLAVFCDEWRELPMKSRPHALRLALLDLTTIFCAEPLQAEIWLNYVAAAAELPKTELRALIRRRAEIVEAIPELYKKKHTRDACKAEILSWIL
jgi:hypothetical protein